MSTSLSKSYMNTMVHMNLSSLLMASVGIYPFLFLKQKIKSTLNLRNSRCTLKTSTNTRFASYLQTMAMSISLMNSSICIILKEFSLQNHDPLFMRAMDWLSKKDYL